MAKPFKLDKRVKYKKLGQGDTVEWSKEGQVVEGLYRSARKTTYEGREVLIHRLQTGADKTVELWDSTVLNKLTLLLPGTQVRITYLGKAGKGKRKYNNFSIEVPEDARIKESDTPF